MKNIAVIGATGEVGGGIVQALLARGHHVTAIARSHAKLTNLAQSLGNPTNLTLVTGSLESDSTAAALVQSLPPLDAVAVSVNGPRVTAPIYTAARAFIPILPETGVFLGIGGGSADFILEDGAHLSAAQAGLRMLYRGLALETPNVHVKELTVASVVNSPATRAVAHELWVTDLEIGEHVARIIENPGDFPNPIWRLTRRDGSGLPGFAADSPTRVQGFKQAAEVK
jgi:NAD(P)-dependent dehydrogenase (short-subunit alcohol dehydrogenase family)